MIRAAYLKKTNLFMFMFCPWQVWWDSRYLNGGELLWQGHTDNIRYRRLEFFSDGLKPINVGVEVSESS